MDLFEYFISPKRLRGQFEIMVPLVKCGWKMFDERQFFMIQEHHAQFAIRTLQDFEMFMFSLIVVLPLHFIL